MTDNITWSTSRVERPKREAITRQRGCVLWLTGLSGSGKSTLSHALEDRLIQGGHLCYVLDGDNLRHGLNSDLGFSPKDRAENIRRVGEVAALVADMGLIAITAFISPYREDRRRARAMAGDGRFLEVWVKADVAVCESRDPKGLYKKARAGLISDFTGISAPYEEPEHAEVTVNTGAMTVPESITAIMDHLKSTGILATVPRA